MSNSNNFGLSVIADRYAKALIEIGEDSNLLDEFGSNISTIESTLVNNKDLKLFLEHPTIPLQDKKEIVSTIFKDAISIQVLNLLKLLLDRNRIVIFPALASHYHDSLNKKRNIVIAQVTTAIEIDEEIKSRVKSQLENMFSKNIKLEAQTDPEIIAGMIVKVGDRVIDGSIRTKLDNMKKQLI